MRELFFMARTQEVKKIAQGYVSGFLKRAGQNAVRVRRVSMPGKQTEKV